MFNPFEIFATSFHAPFSGDVIQNIEPRLNSPEYAGSPGIEARVQREVASYGKQLGKITEALLLLSQKTGQPLPEIEAIVAGVEEVKAESRAALRQEAEAALARLRSVDEEAYRGLLKSAP